MSIPELTYQVEYPSEQVGVLSKTPPYNTCDVIFSCNEHIKTFKSMVTYEDDEYGKDKGLQIKYLENQPANTQITFQVNSITDLIQGDGQYRIGLYVQNDEGIWNEYFLFITTESDGTHKTLITSNNREFNVL